MQAVNIPSFRDRVYEIAKTIPAGKVMTYGQLAQLVGNPRAARAVGMCMRTNTDPKIVPCHRVVASNGKLTGYAFGAGVMTKKELLEKEGVIFVNDKVDLVSSLWNPTNR